MVLVAYVTALDHQGVLGRPLALDLNVTQCAARLGVVGVQFDDSIQMRLALDWEFLLPAPLGQGPLAFDRIRVGGPNLFVFLFLGPAIEHFVPRRPLL